MNASDREAARWHAPQAPSRAKTLFDDRATCRRCGGVITRVARRCVDCGHDPAPQFRVRLDDGTITYATLAEVHRGGR
jgi:hypothetical protein